MYRLPMNAAQPDVIRLADSRSFSALQTAVGEAWTLPAAGSRQEVAIYED